MTGGGTYLFNQVKTSVNIIRQVQLICLNTNNLTIDICKYNININCFELLTFVDI